MGITNTDLPGSGRRLPGWKWLAALLLAALGGAGGCYNPVLGPDAISLGMNVTEVREKMGGPGRNDPGDFSTTDAAHITEFYWNYDEIRVHFNMQMVVEIYRIDPQLGIWVRTQPPKTGPEPEKQARPQDNPPSRPVPGMRTPGR